MAAQNAASFDLVQGAVIARDPAPFAPVKYLQNAYDALAGAYVLFFNYPRAAETYDKISTNPHFAEKSRRESARAHSAGWRESYEGSSKNFSDRFG